ncbi:MAG: thioredoxin [Proteobacteria bacterium]|nr:thioredoxin [Pseudomonadota bacterium]
MNEVTDQTIDAVLSENTLPVLIDFWAEWCGPCRMLAPVFEEVGALMADKVACYKLNVDESPETTRRFHVMSIPTLILFKDGKVVATSTGFKSKEDLKRWIESF